MKNVLFILMPDTFIFNDDFGYIRFGQKIVYIMLCM